VKVGVTEDIRGDDGNPVYDLSLLDESPHASWEWMSGAHELSPADLEPFDAILLFHPKITAAGLQGAERLRLIARLGVGVDNVDVPACTAARVLVTTTPDSVRRPMASGAMAFILALAHRLPERDRHVRSGGWDRFAHIGIGLDGRTLGILGLGNVGRDLVGLAAPFGLRIIAHDPFVTVAPDGVELCTLETLLETADIVVVACPLTAETRHLLNAERLATMKSTAYLVNIARGPIVDGAALADALRAGRLAGAGLDVFEREPVDPDDPLLTLENVITAPHAVGLTDELFRLGGISVSRAVLDVHAGRMPEFPLNPEAAPGLTARSS